MPVRVRLKNVPPQRHFIKEWRVYRGLSQAQVAERLETSEATISRIETGKQPYTEPVLAALAWALSCEPADLIMRDPNNPVWSIMDGLKSLPPDQQQVVADLVETLRRRAA